MPVVPPARDTLTAADAPGHQRPTTSLAAEGLSLGPEEGGVSGSRQRWEEVDPWGHRVSCDEAVWADKAGRRAELSGHEAEVRATIRDPDRLYFDEASTLERAVRTGARQLAIVHYVSDHRAHGKQAGNLIVVVVKWLGEAGGIRGYVHTAYLPDALQSRLQLLWRRPQ